MGELLAFLAVAALVIVTPGPDTALTIRNTLLGGRSAGVLTAAGVSAGQAVWTVAASAGVAALLVASAPLFTLVKLLGGAYLVYLGAQALVAAVRGLPAGREVGGERFARESGFRQGLLSNLGNPKMAVFFTSLLPQFAPGGGASFASLLALGLLFAAMTLVWLAAYAAAVSWAGEVLRRGRVRRILDALTGAVLVALGLRVATSAR